MEWSRNRFGSWAFIHPHAETISPFEPNGVGSYRMRYRAEGSMAKATVALNNSHMFGKGRIFSCRSQSCGVFPNHVFEHKATAGTGEEHRACEPVEMLQAIF